MSRSIEPVLLSLLPTYPTASSLPPSLVDLTSSLLAQSRHHASALKAEEEVARSFACAHIACEHLKTTLDLPAMQVRPPVPPRAYKRLYEHLERTLSAARTPRGKQREGLKNLGKGKEGAELESGRKGERPTPGREAALARYRSPVKKDGQRGKSGTSRVRSAARQDELPLWVRPVLRSLCEQLCVQGLGRTALAGMQTIVVPLDKRTKDAWVNENLTALVGAVVFVSIMRVRRLQTGKDLENKRFNHLVRDVVTALREAKETVEVKGNMDTFWDGWTGVGSEQLMEALGKMVDSAWQDEVWFTGIDSMVESGGLELRDDEDEDADVNMLDEPEFDKGERQRSNTMFQSRWVMTKGKRQAYSEWKAKILRRADQIQAESGSRMDVDVA